MSGAIGTTRTRRAWGRKRILWTLAAVVFTPVAVLLGLSLVVAVVVLVTAATGGPLPGALQPLLNAGPLGDIFGGLLGSLLNATVLGTTVAIALDQGRQARSEQRDAENRFREEMTTAAEHEKKARAEKVVAWVAETRVGGASHLGVVVTNASNTLVRDLDLLISVKVQGTTKLHHRESEVPPRELRNRESVVPPGTWFLQIDRGDTGQDGAEDGDDTGEPGDGDWSIPQAVDTDGQLRVRLPVEDGGDEQLLALHVHPPEKVNGVQLPYYELEALRFELQGETWWRDSDGALTEKELKSVAASPSTWEKTYAPLASKPRTPATAPRQVHQKNPEVQEQVRRIAAALTGREPGSVTWNQRYDVSEALRGLGIARLRVAGGGQGIDFFAGAPDHEPVMWMAGNARSGDVPAVLHVIPRHGKVGQRCKLGSLRKKLAAIDDPAAFAAVFTQQIVENVRTQGTLCGCERARASA